MFFKVYSYVPRQEERWDVAWNPREMGSTREGGMREGPAPQEESKISS
jgi:hypothetical protein